MKISGGIQEKGVVVGNNYDKYSSSNPIVQWIMQGFRSNLNQLIQQVNPSSIHEVGCGEGYWTLQWATQGFSIIGSDFSEKIIDLAKNNAKSKNLSPNIFKTCSIYDLHPKQDAAELTICCEVLEHLEDPERALAALQAATQSYLIISVPREPLWCMLNMARGKYLSTFGNTPGHIQKWSRQAFINLVSKYFKIETVLNPLPWTMLLCRK